MIPNSPRISYLFSRLLNKRKSISALGEKIWELSPGYREATRPAIMLPGQLDLVTGLQEETNIELEHQRVLGGSVYHAPTRATRIRRVALRGAYLYHRSLKVQLGWASERALVRPACRIAKGAVACTVSGSRYFGHWLTDDASLAILAAQFAPAISIERPKFYHQVGYEALFDLRVSSYESADFDSIHVFEDFSQTENKRVRYELMRSRVRQELQHPVGAEGVMLLRGRTGISRVLQNEAEIAELCSCFGWRVLDPAAMSIPELLEQMLDARIVIGVEGSHLAHAVYALRGGGVIFALQPPYRFNNVLKNYADCLGFHYALVVGESVPGGFRICPDSFERTLDLISRRTNGFRHSD
ncbi:MAG: glycosyltransferase family 61 protein [Gammaproteobacteria bacterium]|nr:glycosyltransferase family 61 protein [Gammaproteobacteria bacterium]